MFLLVKAFRFVVFSLQDMLWVEKIEQAKPPEAQLKRRSFRVPNLFPSIKYMKRFTFEPNLIHELL